MPMSHFLRRLLSSLQLGLIALFVIMPSLSRAAYPTTTVLSKVDAGDGKTATEAYLDEPKGLEGSGQEFFVTDSTNNVIEKINAAGTISTVAGSRAYGYKDGFAPKAEFANPQDVTVAPDGTIYVADTDNNVIRKITGTTVSTWLTGLNKPTGVALVGETLYISDTGNNRILHVFTQTKSVVILKTNLQQPTKLIYWDKANSLLFVNKTEGSVRALRLGQNILSNPLISNLEDIGGIYRDDTTLYVAASHDIGVFNELWKVALTNTDGSVQAGKTERLAHVRESEQLNWASDVTMRQDSFDWEEYYNWLPNVLYADEVPELITPDQTQSQTKVDGLSCLKIRQQGSTRWQKKWSLDLDPNQTWQQANFILKYAYQGDEPYFRIQLYNEDSAGNITKRSKWKNGREIVASTTGKRKPVKNIMKINPDRGVRIRQLKNGNFLTTLRFEIPAKKPAAGSSLKANVQLCSTKTNHADTVTAKRLYVLYKGGASILVWKNDGTDPLLYAGKHRFQQEFGNKATALVGRPKAIVLSSDHKKMYLSQNNQIAEYDLSTQTLKFLAGHLMDSYTEGQGDTARFSDPTSLVLSPDNKKLYIVDRNNNRIRKLNIATGTTKYLTGAGSVNYAFKSTDSNGYQEGKACPNTFTANQPGCAYFNRPTGITISPDGKTLYIAEGSNNRIRAVKTKSGKTSLIAGSGTAGFKDGAGGTAQFNGPYTVAISADGKTLYVADKYNSAIRKIDLASQVVTTLIGKGKPGNVDGSFSKASLAIPEYITFSNNALYWTEAGTNTVRRADLSSQMVTTLSGGQKGYREGDQSSAKWNNPKGIVVADNTIYVADYLNDLIRSVGL